MTKYIVETEGEKYEHEEKPERLEGVPIRKDITNIGVEMTTEEINKQKESRGEVRKE